MKLREIKIKDIKFNPYQCRTKKDRRELGKLSESIKLVGVKQPISVYKNPDYKKDEKKYLLESGERRCTASIYAGKETIKAIIKDGIPTENDLRINSIIENCLREDLNPIDKAKGLQSLLFTIPNVKKSHNVALLLIRRLDNVRYRHKDINLEKYEDRLKQGHAKTITTKEDLQKCDEILKMIGISEQTADELLQLLELPEEIQNKVIYKRDRDKDKGKSKKFGYLTVREAIEIGRLKNHFIEKEIYEKYIHSQMGLPGLNALISSYIPKLKAENPELYLRVRKGTPADFGVGKIAGENMDYATKLDHFRDRNLVAICSLPKKKEYMWSLAELRSSVLKLKKAVDSNILTTADILKETEKENEETREEIFHAMIERGKHGREVNIPKKIMDALSARAGDVLKIKIYSITRREALDKLLVRKGNTFKLTKFISKKLWSSINSTCGWYFGFYEKGKWNFRNKADADKFEETVRRKLLLRAEVSNNSIEDFKGDYPRK